ncbi:MAG: fatty acyl-AMP ligase [Saccharothrix sp.]|nr:fatty acyl-AMP ligase [Saccharothrix sp.]
MSELVRFLREKVWAFGDARWYARVDSVRGELVEVERLGYAQLDARARAIGAWLVAETLPGAHVMLMYPAGLEFLAAFLGCLYSGRVAVPVPLPNTDRRASTRAEGVVHDADIHLILTDAGHQPDSWSAERDLPLRCVASDQITSSVTWSPLALEPSAVAYVQYTSGSTSEPRGVVVTHGNLLHNLLSIREVTTTEDIREEARSTTWSPPLAGWLPHYHDMGLVGMLLGPMASYSNLVFSSPVSFVAHPRLWLQMISHYRASHTIAPDFGYDWLLRSLKDDDLTGLDLSSLRFALSGGEPVRAGLLDAVARRLAPIGFRRDAWAPSYGLAESTLMVTGTPCGSGATVRTFDREELETGRTVPAPTGLDLVACGSPVDTDLRIIDPHTRDELKEGDIGEIWVRGGSVATGYLGNAEATAEHFAATTSDGDGPFLRTGDLGFLFDDELYVTGRAKDLIISNGRNIHPQDIERIGESADPAAGRGAAFTLPDSDAIVLVQEVQPLHLTGRPPAVLADLVRRRVAEELRLAVQVVIVAPMSVPRTTSGKVQRARTRDALRAGRLTTLHSDRTSPIT